MDTLRHLDKRGLPICNTLPDGTVLLDNQALPAGIWPTVRRTHLDADWELTIWKHTGTGGARLPAIGTNEHNTLRAIAAELVKA